MAVPRPQAVLLAVCLLLLVAVPGLAQAPSLSATKTVTIDTPTNGEADPGDTLTYTVVITNAIGAAAQALNVRLRDVIDPNTTYVANSLATVPVARGDS